MRTALSTLPILLFICFFLSCSNTSKQEQQASDKAQIEKTTLDTSLLFADDGKWQKLFNGKDLEGWEIITVKEEKVQNFWTVVDGAIVANSTGSKDHYYIWLQTEKEYADFVLKLKFQSYRDSPGNSGIQIRSRFDKEGKLEGINKTGWLDGPQIDVHPPDPWRTGFIYDETRGHQRWIYPSLPDWNIDKATYAPETFLHYYSDEAPYWNDLAIVCKGNRITTYMNGIMMADFDGTGVLDDAFHQKRNVDKKGYIALQLHKDDELKIGFKDIEIKEL